MKIEDKPVVGVKILHPSREKVHVYFYNKVGERKGRKIE